MKKTLEKKTARGTVWASIDRFSVLAITFLVNLLMARILSKDDYGLIAMITIFTNISAILVDGGFGNALIQKKNPTQKDYSTIFFWNFGLAIILYLTLYFSAPLIARFYQEPQLIPVVRLLALIIIFNSLMATQVCRLRKQMNFKTLAIVNISAAITGGIVGVALAYRSIGVYALVWSQVITCLLQFLVVSILGRWHPSLTFSFKSFRELFAFGGYLLAANVLQVFCNNLQNVIIGKRFSVGQLGLYSQAQTIDNITSYQIPQILVQVMFPVYSSLQDRPDHLCRMLEINMRVVAYVMFPLLTLLIILAEPTFTLLYTAKWAASAPYFQILCCGGFFVALQNINFYAVAAKGKSRTLFLWSFYKWGLLLLLMIIGSQFGIFGLLSGLALNNFNIFMVNAALASKHVGFRMRTQARILLPIFVAALCCGVISCIVINSLNLNVWFVLPIYIILYLTISMIFRARALRDTINAIRTIR